MKYLLGVDMQLAPNEFMFDIVDIKVEYEKNGKANNYLFTIK